MVTPEKYRDRIFAAVVRFAEADPRTQRERRDAYEDLMEVIDAVIEELSTDPHAPTPPAPPP